MHFTLTYDIYGDPNTIARFEKAIDEVMNGYSCVKPLTTAYVVRLNNQFEWNQINDRLSAIAAENQGTFFFLMSPPMNGGFYNGWLSNNLWSEINTRTN